VSKIILLVVGAAWAAVLLPPLLRSRVENRPSSSVVDFRRQLSTLQRTVPSRGMAPMRSMARPLAPSPRPASRAHRHVSPHPAHATQHLTREEARARHVPVQRERVVGPRAHHAQAHVHRAPTRAQLVRQRRQNVLFGLVAATAITAFCAFTTQSDWFVYAFVLSAISLVGYCYKLVQLRQQAEHRAYGHDWFRAA
jgi:hypothetical protein